jgi:hypothetical protein
MILRWFASANIKQRAISIAKQGARQMSIEGISRLTLTMAGHKIKGAVQRIAVEYFTKTEPHRHCFNEKTERARALSVPSVLSFPVHEFSAGKCFLNFSRINSSDEGISP